VLGQSLRRIFCETLGTMLSLPDTLQRIVSFSPAVTETLFLLGVGDSVAGVSAFCARPEEARKKRVIGSYNTVDKNLLKELNPGIIFTVTGYQREFAVQLSKDMPVYAIELPVSVAGIVDMVVKVGLITNRIPEATALSRRLQETIAHLTPIGRGLRVYVEIDFSGPVSFGAYSYITDALRLLGVESVYGKEACEWLTPDLEFVKQADPDVIIYEAKMYSRFNKNDLNNLLEKRGWTSMHAVRQGRVFMTPRPLDFLAHHGPSFITTAMPWLKTSLDSPLHPL
jgi:ABC-type Fe3+-hydroxamate transport system substrate-binding protein